MPRFNDLIKIYALAKFATRPTSQTNTNVGVCVYYDLFAEFCRELFIIHKKKKFLPKLTEFRISLFDLDAW